jgi:type II secretory pathway pseudopilin PulG
MTSAQRGAFTMTEMVVVIGVIVLVLAMAVPGLNAMATQSRHSQATQVVNGALTRAHLAALADMSPTAVRFVPGAWDADESAEPQRPRNRQHIVLYSYVAVPFVNPVTQSIQFREYFERRAGAASTQLPEDVWVAPAEALDDNRREVPVNGLATPTRMFINLGADLVLNGRIDDGDDFSFRLDAGNPNENFFQADDFLIVFDPQTGLRTTLSPLPLKAYDPLSGQEKDRFRIDDPVEGNNPPYQRYNFTGVALYGRSAFLSLGRQAGLGQVRQDWLKDNARPYLVSRFGGELVMGNR